MRGVIKRVRRSTENVSIKLDNVECVALARHWWKCFAPSVLGGGALGERVPHPVRDLEANKYDKEG